VKRTTPRGVTLIEAMVALSVMLIGAVGMVGLHRQGQRMNADAVRITRATAIAQDLLNQMSLWPYGDPRLANANPGNDLTVGDPTFAFEQVAATPWDYDDTGLQLGGTTWLGIPAAEVAGAGYQRYWNVSYAGMDSNGNGIPDGVRIAAVVRWPSGTGFRRVVLLAVKSNPAESR
jgi:prepilin-type N-terminal cleavage/methylation domain-containing protein